MTASLLIRRALLVAGLIGASTGVEARSLEDVVASGSIDICVQESAAPFSEEAGDTGIFLDLGKLVARGLGVRLNETWVFSAEYIRKTNCDIVPAVAAIPADDPLKMTRPYMRVRTVLVSGRDAHPLNTIDDLRQDTIAVLAESYARHALNKEGLKLSVAFLENDEILDAVAQRQNTDGVVTLPSFEWYVHEKKAALRANFGPLGTNYDYDAAMGLRKADRPLVDRINGLLRAAMTDGSIARIFERYGLTYDAPTLK